jgi:hypothetical protein
MRFAMMTCLACVDADHCRAIHLQSATGFPEQAGIAIGQPQRDEAMDAPIATYLLLLFPLAFLAFWFFITTLLALLSGWFRLMKRFPDRAEDPILRLSGRSGSMGLGVGLRGVLTLSVCPSGLRVGILRIFGPFSRDFLVPWDEIAITRSKFWSSTNFRFGNPVAGILSISQSLADQLAGAAEARWPEPER